MDGLEPFSRRQVPGAIPNGTTVIKVNSPSDEQDETGAEDGDRGVILGSTILTEGENGPIPPELAYYVEWDHAPKYAHSAIGRCIAPLRPTSPASGKTGNR